MVELNKNIKEELQKTLLASTATIVSAYISNNNIDTNSLKNVIEEVYSTLVATSDKTSSYALEPFVEISQSVKPDYIICLEDGKKFKMLKRYLKTKYNMTDKEYREKWGLPSSYPMIAPNYAKKRSSLAVKSGLGKK